MVSAQNERADLSGIQNLILQFSNITGMLVPVFIALAVLAFFFFMIQFIWKGKDDPKVHDSGIKGMGYSILAIFVMVSIWGLVGFLGNLLGIGAGGNAPQVGVPTVQENP